MVRKSIKRQLTGLFMACIATVGLTAGSVSAAAIDPASAVKVVKVYNLLNEGTEAPGETFTFTVEKEKVEKSDMTIDNMPLLTLQDGTAVDGENVSLTYNPVADKDGEQKELNLAFPLGQAKVGVYTYKITEQAGDTAGTVYSTAVVHAAVTVVNNADGTGLEIASVTYTADGDKLSDGASFVNQYQAVADMSINKTVTGNLGDKTKYFDVSVTLNGPEGKDSPATFAVEEGLSNTDNPSAVTTGEPSVFHIKHGETIHIKNVPYGYTYTVTEADYVTTDGYDKAQYSLNGTSKGTTAVMGEEADSASESVIITNNKQTKVDTGVVLDNLPYILLLGGVLVIMVILARKKKG